MIFKFQYDGKSYEFDDARMGLGEARWIKAETGLYGTAFFEAVQGLDPDAISAMIVIAMRRGGVSETTMESIAENENGYFELIGSVSVHGDEENKVRPTRKRVAPVKQ